MRKIRLELMAMGDTAVSFVVGWTFYVLAWLVTNWPFIERT